MTPSRFQVAPVTSSRPGTLGAKGVGFRNGKALARPRTGSFDLVLRCLMVSLFAQGNTKHKSAMV